MNYFHNIQLFFKLLSPSIVLFHYLNPTAYNAHQLQMAYMDRIDRVP